MDFLSPFIYRSFFLFLVGDKTLPVKLEIRAFDVCQPARELGNAVVGFKSRACEYSG